MIDNPFWTHFTYSLKKLCQLSLVLHRDVTMEITIWFIPMLKIDYKQKRFSRGKIVIGDVFSTLASPILDSEEFNFTFSLKTIF